jgi:hypothetical protein
MALGGPERRADALVEARCSSRSTPSTGHGARTRDLRAIQRDSPTTYLSESRASVPYHPAGLFDPEPQEEAVLGAYTFGQAMWTMFVFFMWILWFWLLFTVFGDLFRRHDIGGWGKAGWCVFVIVLPFLGVFVYLIAEGKAMGERNVQQAQAAQSQMDAYVRSVAGSGNAAEQIAQAKGLLDSGAITQVEFDQLKAKALAG